MAGAGRLRADASGAVATLLLGAIAKVREAIAQRANAKASRIAPAIRELQSRGAASLKAIAEGLNEMDIPTPRGGRWQAV